MDGLDNSSLAAGGRLAVIIMCLVTIGLVVVRVAAATPPAQATGNGTITSGVITLARIANGNTFLDVAANATVTGTFSGAITYQLEEVVHEDGSVNFHGFGTFTGTSPCGTGTTTFEDNGSGPTRSIVTAHLGSVEQAESTSGLHAEIDVTQLFPMFTYSGTFECS